MRKYMTLKGFNAAFWCRNCRVEDAIHQCIRCGSCYCNHAYHDKDPFCMGCHKMVFKKKRKRSRTG